MQLIYHPCQQERQITKQAGCALSNPDGKQLKLFIAGVALETNEKKLNGKWKERGLLVGDLGISGTVQ